MLQYPNSYLDAKKELSILTKKLNKEGHIVFKKEKKIINDLTITRYLIKAKKEAKKRLIFSIGVHGIEGYVGHACLHVFFDELFSSLNDNVEVVIYHPVNPHGMFHLRRTNESNVDLNRNFSSNDFTSENNSFKKMESFFAPKKHKTIKGANFAFYSSLSKHLIRYKTKTITEATLLGQKANPRSIYYSNNRSEKSTTYLLNEMETVLTNIEDVIWIDLHTGYGPRYQMSVVNSQYEKEQTKDLMDNISYPRILGISKDDFYDIDGDMIEKIYEVHKKKKFKSNLYATCFEFGTLGEKTINSISSLKALIFENDCQFEKQSKEFKDYSKNLIKEQFMPSEDEWKEKAHQDFLNATSDILRYYRYIVKN